MALYAISDLHLGFNSEKPMDIFGEKWLNHDEKIKENWLKTISNEDVVLIAGDISWSMKVEEGKLDLDFINNLPGKKLLVRGNHDYWWSGIKKLNSMYDNMNFIQNNYFQYKDYAICGSRGWITPINSKFTTHDKKIYDREIIRLKLSLDSAKKDGFEKIIVMLHYPPANNIEEENGFTEILNEYNVEKVIYGHIHGSGLNYAFEGEKNGIEYILTSCDHIDFEPLKIL
ncbi:MULTISPECIES: metallophosphoesterase [Clostridium]|uniref:Serine/threonine protein phosphatase n=1 Tax=Clostridium senegalense TaxID=1465809 RepID=A0A6M0GZU8_9CLOT|nr:MULTISPECIES: metallophosphoesterase [Clostridium]NEU03757.1 serine/threonine protein phosphatase [Clostridium senegalense]